VTEKTIFLKDYTVPVFLIEKTELYFDLHSKATRVRSRLQMRHNPESNSPATLLTLHGVDLTLISVSVDQTELSKERYVINEESLDIKLDGLIDAAGGIFDLAIETEIDPLSNTSLEGLYQSSGMFCTQCEAQGFRKISYYLDRPDVMSEFTTTIEADADDFPVMLSNGNKTADSILANGRRCVSWHDPFKKPAYLFALVAGNLQKIEDTFTTMSGRDVILQIFVEAKDLDKCAHAMDSLKRSMTWDEEVYGREYDLDIFMIVAVDDFNMGAMENKGLNIFNTSCVLAKPETTTDMGFQRVEAVVAHEYFHNWSGNRVTCRDWFQLSLKEGFTVFRDASFSSDMGSATVKRVEDVSLLRSAQFPEDGGPLAHAVQPASFIEISNFYTLTIYEKGAELVRMLHTLLGAENFRAGSDLYFDRHDGQAVTIDDFVAAMADASGRDLQQFTRWYHQASTPVLAFSDNYDEPSAQYTLNITQSCPPSAETDTKLPFHIPVSMSLIGEAGALPLHLRGAEQNNDTDDNTQTIIELKDFEQSFVFEKVNEKPVASVMRGFSAPVRIEFHRSNDDLRRLMTTDNDGFCRWDACQQFAINTIEKLQVQLASGSSSDDSSQICEPLVAAYRSVLQDVSLDPAMVSLMLTLPSLAYLIDIADQADVKNIDNARETLRLAIAEGLHNELQVIYQAYDHLQAYQASAEQIAARSLKNTALAYLMLFADKSITGKDINKKQIIEKCQWQFSNANNMTDVQTALHLLVNAEGCKAVSETALESFYKRWKDESLVVNIWFSLQASSRSAGALERVKALMGHDAFELTNPNKLRSVVSVFCNQNPVSFHAEDGSAYEFLSDLIIKVDSINPQIASRLLTPLTRWAKFDKARQDKMKAALNKISEKPDLSKDVYEIVNKSL